jgi:para-nitrobenzyl esterase
MNGRTLAILGLAVVCITTVGSPRTVASAADRAPLVSTLEGWVRGLSRPGGGAEFLGIPYAEPPVGRLRWRAPVPVGPWHGLRPATTLGPQCAQPPPNGWKQGFAAWAREDCLYLNVIAPQWPARKLLPVMFWIHGGGNVGDTANKPLFNDGTLVEHGVVLVTFDYRLGVFGFLADPALSSESPHHASGDYGLMDQILALQWVHANIARFGGDPHNITVFGQSAGGTDTGLLMISGARRLFQKAIEESGAPIAPLGFPPLARAEQIGARLVAALGAPAGAAGIAFLRKIPAGALLTKVAALPRGQWFPPPDVDGWVIPNQPAAAIAAGRESPIPLLIGTTTRENKFPSGVPFSDFRSFIQRGAGALAPKILATYGLAQGEHGLDDPKYGSAIDQLFADVAFRCPAVLEARWHTDAGHAVYEYEFERPMPGHSYALHAFELPYVFGQFPKTGWGMTGHFTATDYRLSDLMERYWTNFARTGDPNAPGLPDWPRFGRDASYIQFRFDGHVAVAHALRQAQCTLYNKWMLAEMRLTP